MLPSAHAQEAVAVIPLPRRIDEIATAEPSAIYGEYPVNASDYTAGFKQISYAQLARAIDAVAHWIEREIGRSDDSETLAYLGHSDVRYVFAFVGAMKAGYKLFLTSPRNSTAAHLSLFTELHCNKIIIANPEPHLFSEVREKLPLRVLNIMEIELLLDYDGPPYPFVKVLSEVESRGAFVSHTSGSTGLPKPCVYNHAFISKAVRNILLPPPSGYHSMQSMMGGNRQILFLPLFHPAGIQFALLNGVYNRTTIVFPSASSPPTVDSLVAILNSTKAEWAILAPLTLEALAKDETALDLISSKLQFIVFSGGSLSKPLGNTISAKLRLLSFLGSSETAGYPAIFPEGFDIQRDWHYTQIHPEVGCAFEEKANGCFELVVKRSADKELYQPVFELYSHLKEYKTNDLFTRHPEWPDMWTHASRSDDIIVLLNGEKTNPVSFEGQLSRHPDVASAVVFGSQRFEAGLLVELKEPRKLSSHQRANSIEKIWPAIELANKDSPAHARISRSHIIIADPDRPIQRTSKDTVKRKETLKLYADTINSLYDDIEKTWVMPSSVSATATNMQDVESLATSIRKAVSDIISRDDVGNDLDFFTNGMDSLRVLLLVRRLRKELGISQLQAGTVYLNPTPIALAQAIIDQVTHEQSSSGVRESNRTAELKSTLQHYQNRIEQQAELLSFLGRLSNETRSIEENQHTVILTGSTGYIGSYVLRALLARPNISRVYCLNRSADAEARQINRHAEIDSDQLTSFPTDRVRFLTADLTRDALGMTLQDFGELSQSTTLIIHNAWPVQFHQPLASFRKSLTGLANLCAFAASSPAQPSLLFISSISAVHNVGISPSHIPESFFKDISAPAAMGYAESKYIAECMLEHAASHFKLDARVARVGQVSGPVRSAGGWNATEWMPRLVRSARTLRALPTALGGYGPETLDINWLPVDTLADALIDIACQGPRQDARASMFQLVNPSRTSWAELGPAVAAAIRELGEAAGDKDGPVSFVSPAAWLELLRASARNVPEHSDNDTVSAMLDDNPALSLVEFYALRFSSGYSPVFESEQAQKASSSLRNAEPVTAHDMKRWAKNWLASKGR